MAGLGMPAAHALQAGTSWAAELLGLGRTAGVIESGATADIVAVTGDPLQDIECLQQVELVIQEYPPELQPALRDEARITFRLELQQRWEERQQALDRALLGERQS